VNKIDRPDVQAAVPALEAALAERGVALHQISAATGEGVPALLEVLYRRVVG